MLSVGAATALAGTRTWLAVGADSAAVWGSCAGEGQLYQTVVDLTSPPAYACSCPSRKVPCKHALALLLQWSDGLVPAGTPPPFAAAWLDARASRKVQPEPAEPVVGPVSWPIRRRPPSVPRLVPSGWPEGSMSWTSGCATRYAAASQVWNRAGYAHFDTMAARMVDAQAPGVAGMLRSIPAEFASAGWPSRVLEQLGALHLLIQAHRRLDDLPWRPWPPPCVPGLDIR